MCSRVRGWCAKLEGREEFEKWGLPLKGLSPPQHELETSQEPIALMCRRDSLCGLKQQPKSSVGVAEQQSEANLGNVCPATCPWR